MKLLREFILGVVLEGKIDDLKKRYPESEEMVEFLYENDPSPSKKYVAWMVKQANDPSQDWNDATVFRAINKFHEFSKKLDKKDINAYVSLDELYDALSSIGDVSKSQIEKDAKVRGAVKLFENDDFLLVYIKGRLAAINYGKGTKWCVSSTETDAHWENYWSDHTALYFVFQKQLPGSNPLYKIAIAFNRSWSEEAQEIFVTDVDLWDANDEIMASMPAHLRPLLDKARKHADDLSPNQP